MWAGRARVRGELAERNLLRAAPGDVWARYEPHFAVVALVVFYGVAGHQGAAHFAARAASGAIADFVVLE